MKYVAPVLCGLSGDSTASEIPSEYLSDLGYIIIENSRRKQDILQKK